MEKELSVSAKFKLIESIRQKPRRGLGIKGLLLGLCFRRWYWRLIHKTWITDAGYLSFRKNIHFLKLKTKHHGSPISPTPNPLPLETASLLSISLSWTEIPEVFFKDSIQDGAKEGLPSWVQELLILVLLLINYYISFHSNNCTTTFAQLCVLERSYGICFSLLTYFT